MADAPYFDNTPTRDRLTVRQLLDQAARSVGLSAITDAGTRAQLVIHLNYELAEARARLPVQFYGLGEKIHNLTWDPAVVDTRIELPADFRDLTPGGKIYLTGDDTFRMPGDVIQVITEQAVWASYHSGGAEEGTSSFDSRQVPVAYLWGKGTTNQRFMELWPLPETTLYIRMPYLAELKKLENDGDLLDAPLDLHVPLGWKLGAILLAEQGAQAKSQYYDAKAERGLGRVGSSSERKRQARFRRFDDPRDRGYQGADYAL